MSREGGGGGGPRGAWGTEGSAGAAVVEEGGEGADGAAAPGGARGPGNAGEMAEVEGAAGEGGGSGNAEGAAAEMDSDEDGCSSDRHETTPVASPPPATAPSVVQTAAELEAQAKAKQSKTPKKDKKETAASVLREYLQAKMADGPPGAGGHEAGSAAGTGGPREASVGEVRLAVVNLLNAFAEKARGQ